MKKYVIEREIPNIGTWSKSNCGTLLLSPTRCSAGLDQTFGGRNLLSLLDKTCQKAPCHPGP